MAVSSAADIAPEGWELILVASFRGVGGSWSPSSASASRANG